MKRATKFVLLSTILLVLGPVGRLRHLSAEVPPGRSCDPPPRPAASEGCAPRGWRHIPSGAPGVWARILADPAGTGTVYVASVGGGIRRSLDGGATWSTVNSGLNGLGVYSLAVDASGPATLYAGVFSTASSAPGGVFKTVDGGANWTLLPATSGQIPLTLTTDSHLPGVTFAGLFGGAIERSGDGGVTWRTVRGGTSAVTSIVIDPNNSNIVYASTLNGSVKSTDGGFAWSAMTALTSPAVWALALHPTNSSILYAATNENGIWRSSDGGASWEPLSALPTVPFSLLVDPADPQTIYAPTSRGVWVSVDAGSTWQPSGLPDRMSYSITAGPDGALYLGTTSGAMVSRDFGVTWTDPDPGLGGAPVFGYSITVDPNDPAKLFVAALGSTVRESTNKGHSWTIADSGYAAREARKINVDPTDSNRVYSGSINAGGLFKSVDGGITWSRRVFGSPSVYVWFPLVDPVHPNVVYAGTNGDGLFKSMDYGDSWTVVSSLPPKVVQGVTVDPRDDDVVFAATTSGLYRSLDGGGTWANVLAQPAWSVTIVGGNSQVLYATTKKAGVYRSGDGGATWQAINDGITDLVMGRAAPVVIDARDSRVLYVASEAGGGVFKSRDGGDHWSSVNLGLDDTSVFGLAADPHRPGMVWASGPHGVFVTTTGGE